MKIDIYTHIIPPKYKNALYQRADRRFFNENWDKVINGTPALTDLDNRLRIIEKYEELSQVLTIASPALEEALSQEDAVYMAELGNNELAELQNKYPGIKFITHHCGAMLPFFSERLIVGQDYAEENLKARWKQALKKPPIEYFRDFYADTALNGNPAALVCGYEFFGPERIVFATDFPYDNENGERFTREVISAVDSLDIGLQEKEMLYHVNAEKILHLGE